MKPPGYFVIFAVLCTSASSIFIRLSGMPPLVIAFYRMVASAVFLAVPFLRNMPGVRLKIDGYCALAGTRAGRMRISSGRAQMVADFLISMGAVDPSNVIIEGHGAESPVASNSTAAGMAANRRVLITILGD